MPRHQGFTLVELLVTVSIVAILATVAVPGMYQLMTSNRLSGFTTEFMGTINYTRSEAVRRGLPITLCRTANGSACGGTWNDGWLVFIDLDADASVDAGDTVLRTHTAMSDNYTLNATLNSVTYARTGMASGAGTFVFCRGSDENTAQAIIVTRTRPRIATDGNDSGTLPEKEDGANIGSCEAP